MAVRLFPFFVQLFVCLFVFNCRVCVGRADFVYLYDSDLYLDLIIVPLFQFLSTNLLLCRNIFFQFDEFRIFYLKNINSYSNKFQFEL